jgi:hypothetical protein
MRASENSYLLGSWVNRAKKGRVLVLRYLMLPDSVASYCSIVKYQTLGCRPSRFRL